MNSLLAATSGPTERLASLTAPFLRRIAAACALFLAASLAAPTAQSTVTVDAGAALQTPVATPVTLGGVVTGQSILDFIIADGDTNMIWVAANELVYYDEISGLSTLGPLQTSTGTTYGWVSGMARDSLGQLYGVDTFHQRVFSLDETTGIVTGSATQAQGSSWNTRLGSMTYDAATNKMYMVDFHGATDRLFSYDLITQNFLVEVNGLPSANARGVALDVSTGLLDIYDADLNQIYRLNPTTGFTFNVVQPVLDPGPTFAGETFLEIFFDDLAFYDGELYGALRFVFDNGTQVLPHAQLQRIDLITGVTRNIGPAIYGTHSAALLLNSVPEIVEWTVDSGPGTVTFTDAEDPASSASFSAAGTYVLRLTVYDSPVVFDTVTVTVPEACNDGLDQDGDGLIDYPTDPGCTDASDATETDPALICDDGLDNDGDGVADALDPGCANPTDTTETDPALVCDDGIDNDGDGLVDFGIDPGCASPSWAFEAPACQDGIDNDGDGQVDFDGGLSIYGTAFWTPDAGCKGDSTRHSEVQQACGLGAELVFVLPVWVFYRKRRLRHSRATA